MSLRIHSMFGFVGALIGGVAATTVGTVITINSDPYEGSWQLALVGVLAAPVLLSIVASFRADATTRAILLLAAAFSSLFFVVLGTLGPLFFPPAILLFIGATKALGESQLSLGKQVFGWAAAFAVGVLMVSAVFALSTSDDARSWQRIRYSDGSEETRRVPLSEREDASRGSYVPVFRAGTSDVVTAREAAQGLLVSAAGIGLAGLTARVLHSKPQPATI